MMNQIKLQQAMSGGGGPEPGGQPGGPESGSEQPGSPNNAAPPRPGPGGEPLGTGGEESY